MKLPYLRENANMAANTSQSQKGSSSRRGGSMLQKIALKKEQLKLYPRMKKIERIGTKLACQVTQVRETQL